MKGRLLLALVLVSLFLSILPAVSRTGTKNEAETSPLSQNHSTTPPEATTDSQTAEGQSLSTPLASNNDTTANAAASTKEPKAYDCSNASLAQPRADAPTPIAPTQPDNLPPERIRPPGLFPVFYDGSGDSADGCPQTHIPESIAATTPMQGK
jgi:hypothetical protein